MRSKLKILILFLMVGILYISYFYIYPEYILRTKLKELFGEDVSIWKYNEAILSTWGYNFLKELSFEFCENHNITYCSIDGYYQRLFLNNIYSNYTESNIMKMMDYCCYLPNGTKYEMHNTDSITYHNCTENEFSVEKYEQINVSEANIFIYDFLINTIQVNSIETSYANLKNAFEDESLEIDEEIGNALLIALSLSQTGSYSYHFVNYGEYIHDECENSTNKTNCVNAFVNKFEDIAEQKKKNLPEFEELEIPECYSKIVYLQIKTTEKEVRKQLNYTEDPFSIIWKSILIKSYDQCSKKVYNMTLENNTCHIIPKTPPKRKVESLAIILEQIGEFGNCSTKIIENEISILDEEFGIEDEF